VDAGIVTNPLVVSEKPILRSITGPDQVDAGIVTNPLVVSEKPILRSITGLWGHRGR